MADLDDFFAKKDRKKSKSKKFATTEEVAKKLEDTKKIEKNVKKERPQEGDEGGAPVQVGFFIIFNFQITTWHWLWGYVRHIVLHFTWTINV